jgi:hypothetical protein
VIRRRNAKRRRQPAILAHPVAVAITVTAVALAFAPAATSTVNQYLLGPMAGGAIYSTSGYNYRSDNNIENNLGNVGPYVEAYDLNTGGSSVCDVIGHGYADCYTPGAPYVRAFCENTATYNIVGWCQNTT